MPPSSEAGILRFAEALKSLKSSEKRGFRPDLPQVGLRGRNAGKIPARKTISETTLEKRSALKLDVDLTVLKHMTRYLGILVGIATLGMAIPTASAAPVHHRHHRHHRVIHRPVHHVVHHPRHHRHHHHA
jgi:hypothetical protein